MITSESLMRTYAGSDAFVRAQKHAHNSVSGTGDVSDMLFLPHIYISLYPSLSANFHPLIEDLKLASFITSP